MAIKAFRLGREAFPRHLVLAFNNARVLWLFGQKDEAIEIFTEISDASGSWNFDPRSDLILSHRTRLLAEMIPYVEYYSAVEQTLTIGDESFAKARGYILASA